MLYRSCETRRTRLRWLLGDQEEQLRTALCAGRYRVCVPIWRKSYPRDSTTLLPVESVAGLHQYCGGLTAVFMGTWRDCGSMSPSLSRWVSLHKALVGRLALSMSLGRVDCNGKSRRSYY